MFRTLIYSLSGACDCAVLQPATRTLLKPSRTKSPTHNESRTKDRCGQHSRKLLMMDILMSETFWAPKKWNKIASDIKFVFYSSTITMMHGPINIGIQKCMQFIYLSGTRSDCDKMFWTRNVRSIFMYSLCSKFPSVRKCRTSYAGDHRSDLYVSGIEVPLILFNPN